MISRMKVLDHRPELVAVLSCEVACELSRRPGMSEAAITASNQTHNVGTLGSVSAGGTEVNGRAARHVEVHTQGPPWLVDLEHDRTNRARTIVRMVADGHAYSTEEDSMVRRFLAMLAAEPAPESDTNTSRPPVGKAQRLKHGPTVDSSWYQVRRGKRLAGWQR